MEKPAQTDRPLLDEIKRRWSPRAFEAKALSEVQIASILEAARWAPSCFNEQPWRFIVASRANTPQFERALSCLAEPNQVWAKNAGLLLFTVAKKTFTRNDKPNRHAMHDVGLAAENMVIQAMSDNLFAHQMAGIDTDKIRKEYGVPEGFEVVAAMAVGHAADLSTLSEELVQKERAARSRKGLDEIAFGDRWDAAFRT